MNEVHETANRVDPQQQMPGTVVLPMCWGLSHFMVCKQVHASCIPFIRLLPFPQVRVTLWQLPGQIPRQFPGLVPIPQGPLSACEQEKATYKVTKELTFPFFGSKHRSLAQRGRAGLQLQVHFPIRPLDRSHLVLARGLQSKRSPREQDYLFEDGQIKPLSSTCPSLALNGLREEGGKKRPTRDSLMRAITDAHDTATRWESGCFFFV